MNTPPINYRCGHQVPVEKVRDANTASWAAQRDCPSCWGAIQREERAKLAKAEADSLGLPDLTGSHKQLIWAESIRTEWLKKKLTAVMDEARAHVTAKEWITLTQTGSFTVEPAPVIATPPESQTSSSSVPGTATDDVQATPAPEKKDCIKGLAKFIASLPKGGAK